MGAKAVLLGGAAGLALMMGCAQPSGNGAAAASEDEAASTSHILGGQADNVHANVGFVRAWQADGGSFEECTGTLIAPNVVLTAGHCAYTNADPTQPQLSQVDFSLDAQPDLTSALGQGNFVTGTITPNPSYASTALGNGQDVSIIILSKKLDVQPMPLGNAPTVGATASAVGYGVAVQDAPNGTNDGSGARRAVDIPVTVVGDHEITAGAENLGTCHGDSGGPLIVDGQIVATVSYGDTADCHGQSHFTRVDDNMSFIQSQLALAGGGASDSAADTSAASSGDDDTSASTSSSASSDCDTTFLCQNDQCYCGGGANIGQTCNVQSSTDANSCAVLCGQCH